MKVRLAVMLITCLFAAGVQAQNYVAYNGGVGLDERATAPETGTKLVFFTRSGSYLANVKVTVKDASGKELVNTVSKGPWLVLNLPSGKYSVRAEVDGQAQGGMITVNGQAQKYGYMFRDQ